MELNLKRKSLQSGNLCSIKLKSNTEWLEYDWNYPWGLRTDLQEKGILALLGKRNFIVEKLESKQEYLKVQKISRFKDFKGIGKCIYNPFEMIELILMNPLLERKISIYFAFDYIEIYF